MPTLQGKNVLVTGAGGFIGSHLVEGLVSKGASVRALAKYNSRNDWGHLESLEPHILEHVEVLLGDITDPFFVRSAVQGCSGIFHLAALIGIPYSYVAPASYVQVNITGTVNVLEAVREHNVEKMIHTSTSEAYGTAQFTPITEEHPLQGQSPYSASKIGADKMVESYIRSFDLPIATLRPFNTYGPRQSARAVIPTIISQALSGDTIRIGSLTPTRDLCYVKDTVAGFLALYECDKANGETIHIGTGQDISIGDLITSLQTLLGTQCRILQEEDRIRPENSEVMQLVCDYSKASTLTGWKPVYSLEDGLRETIEYVQAHLDSYKIERYTV